MPKISLDYFFMSGMGDSASANLVLVMLDEDTGEKYARAVGIKGGKGGLELGLVEAVTAATGTRAVVF